jgi:preprotein translocase subunit YajC
MEMVELFSVLAQAEAKPQTPMWLSFAPMIAIVALFFFMMILPQQKEQKKRRNMLSAMKKNDRVVTIGGIIGTVANLSPDGKEVTVRVDDNTRIRFLRESIARVLETDSESDAKTG